MRKLLFVSIAQCALAASAFGQTAIATVVIPPPFAPRSVWNIGVGSGAQWGSPSDPDVQQLRSLTGVVNAAAYGMPIYSGGSGNPLVTVMDADPGNVAIPPQSIHVPIGAKPAEGTDHHMAFYAKTAGFRIPRSLKRSPGVLDVRRGHSVRYQPFVVS